MNALLNKPLVLGSVIGLVLAWVVGYNNLYAGQRGHVALIQRQIDEERANQEARE